MTTTTTCAFNLPLLVKLPSLLRSISFSQTLSDLGGQFPKFSIRSKDMLQNSKPSFWRTGERASPAVIIKEERRLKIQCHHHSLYHEKEKHNHKVVRLSSRREWRERTTCYFYRRGVFYGLWKIMLFFSQLRPPVIINRFIRSSWRLTKQHQPYKTALNDETPKYRALQ